jgi:long-chain acyl-CoA synthetase
VDRPWLSQYPPGLPADIAPEFDDALGMFRASVARTPSKPLIHYLDTTLSLSEVDRLSDALGCALLEFGVGFGDRVALYLQNVPQFLLSVLACWKVGAVAVPVNPMNKARELEVLLTDSAAKVLICLESLFEEVGSSISPSLALTAVVTTSELDFVSQPSSWPLLAGVSRHRLAGAVDLMNLVRSRLGEHPPTVELRPESVAFLTYTSGTTGPPKGAMNTHGNVVYAAQACRDWVALTPADVIFGIAPLFHITGLIAHLAVALLLPSPLVLGYRFHAPTYLGLLERYRASFTVGAITAFVALMNESSLAERDLSSLKKVYSGGQPVPIATIEAFEKAIGLYIHCAYGLTETTSATHFVPLGVRAPVDPASGAVAAGIPIFNTYAKVIDDAGNELGPGQLGEIAITGPQVIPGYWEKPAETAAALLGGWMRTGDVGLMDDSGWFYVVDRKKDLINASGYKVWPREVEDVLYEHPAIREAAVVGVPDEYRGETVKAFVSLRPAAEASAEELVAFCRQRLAAYKYPRQIEVLAELPKTASGKILRRELKEPDQQR